MLANFLSFETQSPEISENVSEIMNENITDIKSEVVEESVPSVSTQNAEASVSPEPKKIISDEVPETAPETPSTPSEIVQKENTPNKTETEAPREAKHDDDDDNKTSTASAMSLLYPDHKKKEEMENSPFDDNTDSFFETEKKEVSYEDFLKHVLNGRNIDDVRKFIKTLNVETYKKLL